MRMLRTPLTICASAVLASCGGGGSSSAPTPPGTSYNFVTPKAGGVRNYSIQYVDDFANTINLAMQETVTTVSADGSFEASEDDPTNTTITVDNTVYTIVPVVLSLTASDQSVSGVYSPVNGVPYTCDWNPHGAGPTWPISVGDTWSDQFTETCGTGTTTYMESGIILDVESLQVPAGTFQTIKLQNVLTWTSSTGENVTETRTRWIDIATSLTVRLDSTFARSGTLPPTGYVVTSSELLESVQ